MIFLFILITCQLDIILTASVRRNSVLHGHALVGLKGLRCKRILYRNREFCVKVKITSNLQSLMDTLKSYHQSEGVHHWIKVRSNSYCWSWKKKINKTHKIQLIFSLQYHPIYFQVKRKIEERKFSIWWFSVWFSTKFSGLKLK